MSEEGQELVTLPTDNVLAVFIDRAKIEPYIAKVRAIVAEFTGDVSTAKGRDAIRSMARKVVKVKTYIEDIGKDLAAEQKEIPKKIDGTRKYARDTLDEIAAAVRKPLTDWEEVEAARVKKHTDTLTLLDTFARGEYPQTIEAIKANLETVCAIVVGPACEEFEADYAVTVIKAEGALREALAKAEKAESDRLELEALRAEAAKRAEADRIAELQRVAAAKATKDAEDAAEKAKKAAADAAQAELDRVAAQAKESQEAAKRREDALIAANAKAIQDFKDEEARKLRLQEEKTAQEERDQVARETNIKHRAAINRAALKAFVDGGIDEAVAKAVITMIATKMIPAITINY